MMFSNIDIDLLYWLTNCIAVEVTCGQACDTRAPRSSAVGTLEIKIQRTTAVPASKICTEAFFVTDASLLGLLLSMMLYVASIFKLVAAPCPLFWTTANTNSF